MVSMKKCPICGKMFKSKTSRKTCSTKCAFKLGRLTKKLRRKKRTAYRGIYHGIKCDSRWELAFLIYHLEKGHPIKRCNEVFEYTVRGKTHKYYPDFQIRKTIYEVKGKFRKNLKYKLECVIKAGYRIVLIDAEKIQKYLKYCQNKYKTDRLEQLYD